MARPQVRLDEDVAEVLARAAERHGVSISAEANRWLRRALAMGNGRTEAAAVAQRAAVSVPSGRPAGGSRQPRVPAVPPRR